jgi:hypothetical protein
MQTTNPHLFTRGLGLGAWVHLGRADRLRVDTLREFLADMFAPDDVAEFEIRHMTDAEIDAMPEFMGW